MAMLWWVLACGSPVDGTLPEGIYGSPNIGLRVDASGDAVFERSCGRGDLGVVSVQAGNLNADFRWVVTGGAPPLDTGADAGTPASVTAKVSESKIEGEIQSNGDSQEIHLNFGEEPTYFECP